MADFQSLVERKLIPVGKSGNDIIYVCPKCDDKSGHLWVNYLTNKFHCFKCNYGSKSITPLISELGIDVRFDYDSLETPYQDSLDDIISLGEKMSEKRYVDYSKNLKTLTEYYNLHTMPLTIPALNYLHGRGLSDDIISALQIREGVDRYQQKFNIRGSLYEGRNYSGRIMVPSINRGGTISYFVARDYIGTKPAKYLNPPKELAYSSEDIYNLENINSEYVIICEGVFTAIAVSVALGKNVSVATYGKSISAKSNSDNPNLIVSCQGEKLLSKNFKTYYVFYDKDARDSALSTCKYLHDRGAHVRLVTIDTDKYGTHADANDLTREEVIQCIMDSKEYTGFTPVEDLFS